VETRAVADYAFSHPNIAAVLTFTPEDNLMRPWKPGGAAEAGPIRTSVSPADAPYFDFVAEQYREIHGGKNPPDSPEARGSLSEWAYFHYGRWSFACRGWWIPQVKSEDDKDKSKPADEKAPEGEATKDKPTEKTSPEEKTNGERRGKKAPGEKAAEQKPGEQKPAEKKPAEQKAAEEKRGVEDLNALRWFAQQKVDGFVDWKPIEHADFPQRKVEVGGFRPFLQLNPPADQLEPLAEKHGQFVRRLVELLPRLAIQETKVEPLGEGVWRITAVIVNRGYLPTESQMGRTTREPHPLQVQLELPKDVALATGNVRTQLPALAGRGGKVEQTWLVRVSGAKPAVLRLRVWSPSVGRVTKRIELAAPSDTKGETPR
jgi:hypothetical protein